MVVKIILREKYGNKGIKNAEVRLERPERLYADYTDSKGLVEFSYVPDGKYVVKIRHADFQPFTEKKYISENSIIMDIKLQKSLD